MPAPTTTTSLLTGALNTLTTLLSAAAPSVRPSWSTTTDRRLPVNGIQTRNTSSSRKRFTRVLGGIAVPSGRGFSVSSNTTTPLHSRLQPAPHPRPQPVPRRDLARLTPDKAVDAGTTPTARSSGSPIAPDARP